MKSKDMFDKSTAFDINRFTVAKPETGQPRTQREDMIEKFLERINPGRERAGYKPYGFARFARMLKTAGYQSNDLYALYQECDQAKNFSSLLHWKLRNRS